MSIQKNSYPELFTGPCEYQGICPDVKKLRESQERGFPNKGLSDQYEEMCKVGGRCGIRQGFLEEKIGAK